MKQYTLITRLPSNVRRTTSAVLKDVEAESATPGEETKLTAFEGLLDYKPDSNNIDQLLHKGILDENELNSDRYTMSILSPNNKSAIVDNDSEADELLEQYFDEQFHANKDVNQFIEELKEEPKVRTQSKLDLKLRQ